MSLLCSSAYDISTLSQLEAVAQELAIAHRLIGHANIVTTYGVVGGGDHLAAPWRPRDRRQGFAQ
jgi:hypothetical protein